MNPAARAVFRSKMVGLADRLHMTPAEVVHATIRLSVEYARKDGMDLASLHNLVDESHAVATVEGDQGGAG